MKPDIKTEFNRDHYYYHRIDPTPWIPFEEEDPDKWIDYIVPATILAVVLFVWFVL